MKKVILPLLLVTMGIPDGFADSKSDDKNITIIQGQSTADGKSQVTERLLEECIGALPNPSSLEPIVNSSSEYLKEINGDPAKKCLAGADFFR